MIVYAGPAITDYNTEKGVKEADVMRRRVDIALLSRS